MGVTIDQVDTSLKIATDEFDGKVTYGQKRRNAGKTFTCIYSFAIVKNHGNMVHSFIQTISIAPLQVQYYSEALPTQHGCCVGVSH